MSSPSDRGAKTGSTARRALAALLSVPIVLASAFTVLVFGIAARFHCDDSCSTMPSDWGDTSDAWQWSALGWLALGIAVATLSFLALVATNRPRAALIVLVAHVGLGVLAIAVTSTADRFDLRAVHYVLGAGSELAAAAAAALLLRREN